MLQIGLLIIHYDYDHLTRGNVCVSWRIYEMNLQLLLRHQSAIFVFPRIQFKSPNHRIQFHLYNRSFLSMTMTKDSFSPLVSLTSLTSPYPKKSKHRARTNPSPIVEPGFLNQTINSGIFGIVYRN